MKTSYRGVKLKEYRVLLALLILMLVQFSCSTVALIVRPPWIASVYQQKGENFLVTGGPAPSLEDARTMAYSEISYMIKTDVYAVTEDYVNVSSNTVDELVSQQFSISTRTSTNSVLQGIRFTDSFQDVDGTWYVRASISNADLEQSRNETIKQMEELQQLFGNYRTFYTDTVRTLLLGSASYTDQFRLAVSALEQLYTLPSYGSLLVSEGLPRSIHVLSFLTDFLKGASTSLSLNVAQNPGRLKKGDPLTLLFNTSWQHATAIGVVPWKLTDTKTGKNLMNFRTSGTDSVEIPIDTRVLEYGTHRYRLEVDTSPLGLDFSNTRIPMQFPSIDIEFTIGLPSIGLIVETRLEPPLSEDISVGLRSLMGTKLGYPIIDGLQPVQLRIVVQDNKGTAGAYGIEFCHMGMRIEVLVEGSVVHSETLPAIKEAGLGYELAARKAYRTLEENLLSDVSLFANIDAALIAAIEVENE